MIIQFTDNEYGVMLDSLGQAREKCREQSIATPNIDSALKKMCKWGSPAGCQFLVVTDEDANLIAAVTEEAK